MSTHCADKGPAHEHKCGGSDHKIVGLDTYVSVPEHPTTAGVILLTDVFGYTLPNARKFADNLAHQGFLTIIPDFFRGNAFIPPADQTKFNMDELRKWLATINNDKVHEDLHNAVEYLRGEKKIEKVGLVGFCWGGKQAFVAAQHLHINTAISVHGGGLTAEEVPKLKVPTLVVHTEIDQGYTAEQVAALEAAIKANSVHTFKLVPGQTHGFVMRGDFNNPVVAKAAQEVFDDCAAWFKTHL